MKPTRILIVDDHIIVRTGLILFLKAKEIDNIDVVGEAKNGQEAIQKAEDYQPDVILMDLSMPDGNGIDAAKVIKARYPAIKIIILSMFEHEDRVREAINEAGVDGYMIKGSDESSLNLLLQAIEAVQRGEIVLHPRVTRYFISSPAATNEGYTKQHLGNSRLTKREREVLHLLVDGLSNKEIAQQLQVSGGTIKVHVSNILEKLNVNSRTEAAVTAVEKGLVARDIEDG